MLWEAFDVATVVFEVGFLLAILHPLSTRLFVVGAVAFHTGVALVLNIAFLPNLIVYAAVVPWSRLARVVSPPPAPRTAWGRAALLLGTTGFFVALGSPLFWVDAAAWFTSDLTLADLFGLALAWVVVLGCLGAAFVRRMRGRQAAAVGSERV